VKGERAENEEMVIKLKNQIRVPNENSDAGKGNFRYSMTCPYYPRPHDIYSILLIRVVVIYVYSSRIPLYNIRLSIYALFNDRYDLIRSIINVKILY
jgi:hypothetical protein